MQRIDNPFSPGAGRKPAALVGRDVQIEIWESNLHRIENGLDFRPMVLYGLRGIGKTVLLSHLGEISTAHEWIVARFEANTGISLRELLSKELENRLADVAKNGVSSKVLNALKTALSFRTDVGLPGVFTFGIDLSSVSGSNANTGDLSGDLYRLITDLSAATEETETGVALLIDEAQDLSADDLSALSELVHRATQDNLRLSVALAGLPTLPGILSKSKSYAERLYEYKELQPLSPSEAADALTTPVAKTGVTWDDAALSKIVEISHGYPYFLQEYGSACWLAAEKSPITIHDTKLAINSATAALDEGFFRSRWDKISESQRDYLRAMAVDNDGVSLSKDIAMRLDSELTALSPRRAELIRKGLIYAPRTGELAFTVPLMGAYIQRQVEE
ncbi:MAG: AAA family ATPase [Prevotella sp.]|jgi:hypothetical protein|nr:AAA family ATPase [Prevotella sp.]